MRGKNILWMSLIAMLLVVMMANVGFSAPAPPMPEISLDPTGRLPGPGELGHPGDTYSFTVSISNVVDLWACEFTIKYAPFIVPLAPQAMAPGPFLTEGVEDVDWMWELVSSGLEGTITFHILRLRNPPGAPPVPVSGSGILATFDFLVVEAGESPFELCDSKLLTVVAVPNPNWPPYPPPFYYVPEEIEHTCTGSGHYYGTTGRLIRVNLPDYGRKIKAGQVFTIAAKVHNTGDIPLYVRVRFDIHRFDDGRNIEIRTGQTYGGGGAGEPLPYEEFYADEYLGGGTWGIEDGSWSNPGALVGEPDGVYSECTSAYGTTGWYAFPDVTLAGREIQNIDLFGYTSQPDGSTSWDFDPYVYCFDTPLDDSGNVVAAGWCDSMGGTVTWAWTGGRYYSGGPYDMPEYYSTYWHTEAGFNSMQVFVENYCPSGPRQRIDSMYWKVEYASITPVAIPVYTVAPGEYFEMPPVVWPSILEQIGTYELEANIEYSGIEDPAFRHYTNIGSMTKVISFWIVEPTGEI